MSIARVAARRGPLDLLQEHDTVVSIASLDKEVEQAFDALIVWPIAIFVISELYALSRTISVV
jgi:hypothetical protein